MIAEIPSFPSGECIGIVKMVMVCTAIWNFLIFSIM